MPCRLYAQTLQSVSCSIDRQKLKTCRRGRNRQQLQARLSVEDEEAGKEDEEVAEKERGVFLSDEMLALGADDARARVTAIRQRNPQNLWLQGKLMALIVGISPGLHLQGEYALAITVTLQLCRPIYPQP